MCLERFNPYKKERERVDEFKIRPGCIRVGYTEYIYDL